VLTRLDHLVILVRDLDRAIRDYETLGFTVTPDGEHADGLTSNALIPFKDGSYLELVAFLDPDDPRDNVWGWRPFLFSSGGLIDYCLASDDLGTDVRSLEDSRLRCGRPHRRWTATTRRRGDSVAHRPHTPGRPDLAFPDRRPHPPLPARPGWSACRTPELRGRNLSLSGRRISRRRSRDVLHHLYWERLRSVAPAG